MNIYHKNAITSLLVELFFSAKAVWKQFGVEKVFT